MTINNCSIDDYLAIKKQLFDITLMNESANFTNGILRPTTTTLGRVAGFIYEEKIKNDVCLGYRSRRLGEIVRNIQDKTASGFEIIRNDILSLPKTRTPLDFEKCLNILIEKAKDLERQLVNTNIPTLLLNTPQMQNTLYLKWKKDDKDKSITHTVNDIDFYHLIEHMTYLCNNKTITISGEDVNSSKSLDLQRIMGKQLVDKIIMYLAKYRKHYVGSGKGTAKRNGEVFSTADMRSLDVAITSDTRIDTLMRKCYEFDQIYFKKKDSSDVLFYSIIEWKANKICTQSINTIGRRYSAVKNGKVSTNDIINYNRKNTCRSTLCYTSESKMFTIEDNNIDTVKREYISRLDISAQFLDEVHNLLLSNSENNMELIINNICEFCFKIIEGQIDKCSSNTAYLRFDDDYKIASIHLNGNYQNLKKEIIETHLNKNESDLFKSTLVSNDNQYVLTNQGKQKIKILFSAMSAVEELERILESNGYTICDLPLTYYMKVSSSVNQINTVTGFLTSHYYKNNTAYNKFFETRYRPIDFKCEVKDYNIINSQYNIVKGNFENLSEESNSTEIIQISDSIKEELDNNLFNISDICDIAILEILEILYPETISYKDGLLNIKKSKEPLPKDEFARNCSVCDLKAVLGILIMMYRYLYSNMMGVNSENVWRYKFKGGMPRNKDYWYTFSDTLIANAVKELNLDDTDFFITDDYELAFKDHKGDTFKFTEYLIKVLSTKSVNVRDTVYRKFLRVSRDTLKSEYSELITDSDTIKRILDVDVKTNFKQFGSDYSKDVLLKQLCTILNKNAKGTRDFYSELINQLKSVEYQRDKIYSIKMKMVKESTSKNLSNLQDLLMKVMGFNNEIEMNELLIKSIKTVSQEALDYTVLKGINYTKDVAMKIIDKINDYASEQLDWIPRDYCDNIIRFNNGQSLLSNIDRIGNIEHVKRIIFLMGNQFIDYNNKVYTIKEFMQPTEYNLNNRTSVLLQEYNSKTRRVQYYTGNKQFNKVFTVKWEDYCKNYDSTPITLRDLNIPSSDMIIEKYTKKVIYNHRYPIASKESIEFIRSLAPFSYSIVNEHTLTDKFVKTDYVNYDKMNSLTERSLKNKGYFQLKSYINTGLSNTIVPSTILNLVNDILTNATLCTNSTEDLSEFIISTNAKRIKLQVLAPAMELLSDLRILEDFRNVNETGKSIANRDIFELLFTEKSYLAPNMRDIMTFLFSIHSIIQDTNKRNESANVRVLSTMLHSKNLILYVPKSIISANDPNYIRIIKQQVMDLGDNMIGLTNMLNELNLTVENIRNRTFKALAFDNLIINDLNNDSTANLNDLKEIYNKNRKVIENAIRERLEVGPMPLGTEAYNNYLAYYNNNKVKYHSEENGNGLIINRRLNFYVSCMIPEEPGNIATDYTYYVLHRLGFVIIVHHAKYTPNTRENVNSVRIDALDEIPRKKLECC